MDYAFEKIVDLAKEIFEKSTNVSRYEVKKTGNKYFVKIYNNKGVIVCGIEGSYNNVKKVCLLIIEEQKINGGKMYAEQQK